MFYRLPSNANNSRSSHFPELYVQYVKLEHTYTSLTSSKLNTHPLNKKMNGYIEGLNSLLQEPRSLAKQVVFTLKGAAVSLLSATSSLNFGSSLPGQDGVSELPYYGLSPPVYPSRELIRLHIHHFKSSTVTNTSSTSHRQWLNQLQMGHRIQPSILPRLTNDY